MSLLFACNSQILSRPRPSYGTDGLGQRSTFQTYELLFADSKLASDDFGLFLTIYTLSFYFFKQCFKCLSNIDRAFEWTLTITLYFISILRFLIGLST